MHQDPKGSTNCLIALPFILYHTGVVYHRNKSAQDPIDKCRITCMKYGYVGFTKLVCNKYRGLGENISRQIFFIKKHEF